MNTSQKNTAPKVSFVKSVTRGFTLIELLVVISIIGLLSSVVFASLNKARARSRDSKKIQDLIQLRNALEVYYSLNRHYPQTFTPGNGPDAIQSSCTFFTNTLRLINANFSAAANANTSLTTDWIPGLVSSGVIKSLPASRHTYDPGTSAANCYFYMSDGSDYKLSNANALETMCGDNTGQFCTDGILGSGYPYSATISTPGALDWQIQKLDGSSF